MFTCISCRVAFETADEQRSHFATDWHRYNMKRRVAELPPLPANAFNEKVLERREQNAVKADPRGLICSPCSKSFSTENAFRSHLQSRKHRDREAFLAEPQTSRDRTLNKDKRANTLQTKPSSEDNEFFEPKHSEDDDDLEEGEIEDRIAASRRRIQSTHCLFCSVLMDSLPAIVDHMRIRHGFFIPDQEHLSDLSGLLAYLGEKVVIGNLCLYCPNGGREFGTLEAARNHMIDKAHCKMAYESEEDRAEVADFYDWGEADDDWEDEEDGDEADFNKHNLDASIATDGYSLILPSGKILGHRDLKVYYHQRLGRTIPSSSTSRERALQIASVRQNLSDSSQALVSAGGDVGGYGKGLQVMKARNPGEARWARKQSKSFKDQIVRENMKTKVGFKNNNQKHFRDPILQ